MEQPCPQLNGTRDVADPLLEEAITPNTEAIGYSIPCRQSSNPENERTPVDVHL